MGPIWEQELSSVFERSILKGRFSKVVFTPEHIVAFSEKGKPTYWNLKDVLVLDRPGITNSSKQFVKKILQCNKKVDLWFKKAALLKAEQKPTGLPPVEWFPAIEHHI